MINLNSKIYVAGHNGLVGSAIVRELKRKGYNNILVALIPIVILIFNYIFISNNILKLE